MTIRRLMAPVAVLLWLLLVLAWSAGIRPGDPWRPAHTRIFDARALTSISGQSTATADGLRVTDLGAGQALQTWRLAQAVDASNNSILRYRVEDFPRSLELALIFRTREQPGNVTAITLPWVGTGTAAIDLRAVRAWRGHIIELGFSEYALPSQVPPSFPEPDFTLRQAQLESPSMNAALRVLSTRWRAWNPWSGHSINVNRADTPYPSRTAPTRMIALMLLGSLVLLALFGRLRGHGGHIILAALLLGWVTLDVRWLSQLQRNHALATTLFQDKPWAERRHLIADEPLQELAGHLREVLAQQPPDAHILYATPGAGRSARLGYFLRPYNVAPLPPKIAVRAIPDGTLLLIDNRDGQWRWNPAASQLRHGRHTFHGDMLWSQGAFMLFNVRAGAGS